MQQAYGFLHAIAPQNVQPEYPTADLDLSQVDFISTVSGGGSSLWCCYYWLTWLLCITFCLSWVVGWFHCIQTNRLELVLKKSNNWFSLLFLLYTHSIPVFKAQWSELGIDMQGIVALAWSPILRPVAWIAKNWALLVTTPMMNVNLRNHLFTRWSMMQPDRHTALWEAVVFCANLTGSKAPQSALSYLGVLTTQLLQESRLHYISDNHNSYQLHYQLSVFFLLSAAGHLASNGCFSWYPWCLGENIFWCRGWWKSWHRSTHCNSTPFHSAGTYSPHVVHLSNCFSQVSPSPFALPWAVNCSSFSGRRHRI